ncbi:MAG: ATP-binding protein [Bacteroidota bacterium]
MKNNLIGRHSESEVMTGLLNSKGAEMLAVIGRRRVGKTFLVRTVYHDFLNFEITGIQNAPLTVQLQDFAYQLSRLTKPGKQYPVPENWSVAFRQLSSVLENVKSKKKLVLFFDELPWLASRKSGFLPALDHFWNTWACKKNIIITICGSAASWMIDKIVHHKGGLHNRITKLINLAPFTLSETKSYLHSRGVRLDHYQIIQLYMAMGGIPHYLKEIKPGLSAAQNIDYICFRKDGLLRSEFGKLYPALFEHAEIHIKVIKALASKWKGLTRKEIVAIGRLPDGGGLSRVLTELISSGFITAFSPFGKIKKNSFYRLTDEYSLFYLRFIEKQHKAAANVWLKLSRSPSWKSWSGFAFESICLKHTVNIKQALGISGVYTEESGYLFKGDKDKEGLQIDLLIDRQDAVINICEMKFYSGIFTIDKSYAAKLRNRMNAFRVHSKTRKNVLLTFVSSFGIKQNSHSTGLIDNNLTMDVLFNDEVL